MLPAGYIEDDCSDGGEVVLCEVCCERCDLDTYCVTQTTQTVGAGCVRYRVRTFCSDRCARQDAERGGRPRPRGEGVDLWRRSADR